MERAWYLETGEGGRAEERVAGGGMGGQNGGGRRGRAASRRGKQKAMRLHRTGGGDETKRR